MPSLPSPHPRPSQADIDALFAEARRARVIEGGAVNGKPQGSRVLATFEADELPLLRDALRIVEEGQPFHCMCYGDLAIELRGRLFRVGVLSFHHGVSVRLEGPYSDADLIDGGALLRLLAERGVRGPIEAHEAQERENARLRAEHERWLEATPEALREAQDAMAAGGPLGLPPSDSDAVFDKAIAAMRASGDGDQAIAMRLFQWLGTSSSPWSGYPAHENAPLVLLRRLAPDAVLAALLAAKGDDATLGAARYASDHQVISFRKRFVRAIPDARFASFAERLARVPMTPDGLEDAKARLAAAQRIATEARGRTAELHAQRDRDIACVAISDDGPFDSLVTDGDTLAALDVYNVIRIDPEQGALETLTTYEGSPFTELVFAGKELFAVRGNEERIDQIALDGSGRREVASKVPRPLWPVQSGGVICFVSAPFEERVVNGVRSSAQRTSLARLGDGGSVEPILSVEAGVAALAADATHLYYTSTNLEREGALYRVARAGGNAQKLVKSAQLGHAMALPSIVIVDGDAIFADGSALRSVPIDGGDPITIHKAGGSIGAIAALPDGFVLITGGSSDESWDVIRLSKGAASARKLGSLARRPYHRLRMVVRRGQAFFTLDERLYRVR